MLLQYGISLGKSLQTQISQNLVILLLNPQLPNRLENIHITQQWHCRVWCKFSNGLGNCRECYRRTSMSGIRVQNEFRNDTLYYYNLAKSR